MTDILDLIRQHDQAWKDKSIPLKSRMRKCQEIHTRIATLETNNRDNEPALSAGSELGGALGSAATRR